ncbi:MAG: aminotransferase class III-fold pyridoxal phosphate-dependent enzyme [Candidatus Ranarchaeia archaeon]
MNAGIATLALGHNHPAVIHAIKTQADQLIHYSNTDFYYPQSILLAEALGEITPGDFEKKVFFGNSGTEANEAALKLCRYYTGRQRILAFNRCFHGRTYGSMSLTASKIQQRLGFFPMVPGVTHIPYPYCYRCPFKMEYPSCGLWCIDYIEEEIFQTHTPAQEVCCLIGEPIQGEGGYIVPPPDYFLKLKKMLDKYDIKLVMDEVQSGMGRTGKWCAIEHFKVIPDIITMAKAIAGGLPLGAMVARTEMHTWESGSHASTFGGNPVACSAGLAVITQIKKEKLLENATRQGWYIMKRFTEVKEDYPIIGDVRGIGLMVGIELVNTDSNAPAIKQAREFMLSCWKRGVAVILAGKSTIRLSPPLIIDSDTIDIAFEIMLKVLQKIT